MRLRLDPFSPSGVSFFDDPSNVVIGLGGGSSISTTDDLPEGTTNLYSQWEVNTYSSLNFLQPIDTTQGLVIGDDLHSSVINTFNAMSAAFNNSSAAPDQGINYFGNFSYGSGFTAFGSLFVAGRARGTSGTPTQALTGDYIGGMAFASYDGVDTWASSGATHVLPGFYALTTADSTSAVEEIKMFWGGILSPMISFNTLDSAILLNESQLDADIIAYYDGGTSLSMNGADGVWTFAQDPLIPDEAYGSGWNGVLEPPTKNAVYDKIEAYASDTVTFTNKRVTKRVTAASDATSITPDGDTADVVTQANTQALGTLTINSPSGTPTNGQELTLRIKSTNAHTYSFNAIYRGSLDTPLPTTHSGSSLTDYLKFIYNSADSKWDLIAIAGGY